MYEFSILFKLIFTVMFMLYINWCQVISICLKTDINLFIFITLFSFSPAYEQEKKENPKQPASL